LSIGSDEVSVILEDGESEKNRQREGKGRAGQEGRSASRLPARKVKELKRK